MRFKISIPIPAILAITLFVFGIVSLLYYYLTVIDGTFTISVPVSTIGTYLVGLFILTALTFMFLKRRIR